MPRNNVYELGNLIVWGETSRLSFGSPLSHRTEKGTLRVRGLGKEPRISPVHSDGLDFHYTARGRRMAVKT